MTDSNHAPLTERERLARIIERSFGGGCCDRQFLSVEELALEAADDVLADPIYARTAEMRDALRATLLNAQLLYVHTEKCLQRHQGLDLSEEEPPPWLRDIGVQISRARALLGEDKP